MFGRASRADNRHGADCEVQPNMLRFHELRQNPVSVTFRDGTGATITVHAERLRQGLVKMTCECQRQSEAGWCQHCLAVFSDREVFEDDTHRQAFERLVGGTYLEEAAGKLTKALDAFAVVYRQMSFDRPSHLDPSQLKNFANQAYHASTTARHLALALEDFIHELRLRPSRRSDRRDSENASEDHLLSIDGTPNSSSPKAAALTKSPKPPAAPDTTNASFSEDKETALEMVRRALEKDLE